MQSSRDYYKLLDIVNNSIEKNDKMIFFYSEKGMYDNIRAMYDYILSSPYFDDFCIICSLNDYKKYKSEAPQNVKFIGNSAGIVYFMQAKYCFYEFDIYPIKPANEQYVVNLSEGMPFRRTLALMDENKDKDYNYFTHTIASSKIFRDSVKKEFKCEDRQIMICGQPRTDKIFRSLARQNANERNMQELAALIYLLRTNEYSKLIVWVTSYTKFEDFELLPILANKGLNIINEILDDRDAYMFIYMQPDCKYDQNMFSEYKNIITITKDDLEALGIDLFTLFNYSDALITDYNPVFFDYLLTNKPIGFVVDAYIRFYEREGFVFPQPFDYMPGVKIQKLGDFMEFVNACADGIDAYSYDRNEMNNTVNHYRDGRNCERICKNIGLLKDDIYM